MSESQIDLAGAQQALDDAGGMPEVIPSAGSTDQVGGWQRDQQSGRFVARNQPAETPTVDVPPTEAPAVQPETPAAEETPFTHIDDATLTPELLQLKRSLQADYTRKTQEAAPWRKLSSELGVEKPEDFKDALEVYNRLRDPRNWPTIHGELADYMQQYGMTPQEASREASNQLMNLAPDTPLDPEQTYSGDGDEGYSPQIVQMLQQQQKQIADLTNSYKRDKEQQQQATQLQQVAEALTRSETAIRGQNPHYTDDDIEAIYNLMGDDGNLVGAQQRYESIIGNRVARYITSKGTVQMGQPSPVPGAGVQSEEPPRPRTPEEAHRAAMAHVAALEREEAAS